jgi:hypothetical protein
MAGTLQHFLFVQNQSRDKQTSQRGLQQDKVVFFVHEVIRQIGVESSLWLDPFGAQRRHYNELDAIEKLTR